MNLEEISFVPIVERELRRLARRPLTYRVRTAAGLGAAAISLGMLALSVIEGGNPMTLGRQLFVPLALLAFGFSLMTGPILTADCLSEEKRGGTLGLLFLTNLNGFHVVAGKLVAMAMPAVHCLLAILPILAISFFMGGVTGGEFFRTALVLASTLLLSLSASLLASALCLDGRKALGGSVVFLVAMSVGLPGLELLRSAGKISLNSPLLLASPACSVWLVPDANYVRAAGSFWASLAVSQCLSWGGLLLAGLFLPYSWQDKPVKTAGRRWPFLWRAFPPGGPRTRARRERLLAINPILWLAARGSRGNLGIWLFLIGSLAFWLGGYYSLHKRWLNGLSVFFVIYSLHAVLKLWIGWEAGRRFAEDRNNGSLELLLCTPLKEENILNGWMTYLKRRFLAPVVALLLVDFMLMEGGMAGNGWWGGDGALAVSFIAGMGLFVADAYTLCWVGLWQGLTARNPMRATLNTLLYVLVLPLISCLLVLALMSLMAAAIGLPLGVLTALWFAVGYLVDAALCNKAMTQLQEGFRASAIYGLVGDQGATWWQPPDDKPDGLESPSPVDAEFLATPGNPD